MIFSNALDTFTALLSNGEERSLSATTKEQAELLLLHSLPRSLSIVSLRQLPNGFSYR
jgi:hypothetical protein